MPSKYQSIDLSKVRRVPIRELAHKVRVTDFASPYEPDRSFAQFLDSLPKILAGKELRLLVSAIVDAWKRGAEVIFMLGGHVVKTGLSPILIDLMERGVVRALALNGGGAIHDFEIALWGETSEDVERGLKDGTFGMAEETGRVMNEAVSRGALDGMGMGEALGMKILEVGGKYRELSLLARGYELGVPVTVHVALGTDTIHADPDAQGRSYGEVSFKDFQIFCAQVSRLEEGVVVNVGSAVVLPEVFLKALSIARNLGFEVRRFTSANLDMSYQYRPLENVLRRPLGEEGQGIAIVGRHELVLPLLAAGIKLGLGKKPET